MKKRLKITNEIRDILKKWKNPEIDILLTDIDRLLRETGLRSKSKIAKAIDDYDNILTHFCIHLKKHKIHWGWALEAPPGKEMTLFDVLDTLKSIILFLKGYLYHIKVIEKENTDGTSIHGKH